MDEHSPYQPPAAPGPALASPPYTGVPPEVKVFGILHLVFAGLGIVGALWVLFVAIYGNPLMNNAIHTKSLRTMQEKTAAVGTTNSILGLLVAGTMIVAGIKLLKNRRSGLRWSNIYAVSSLLAKAVNLVLTLVIVVPAMRELTREASGTIANAATAGVVGGVVASCLYPALVLIMLNRPRTKAWFAAQPDR